LIIKHICSCRRFLLHPVTETRNLGLAFRPVLYEALIIMTWSRDSSYN
jgi:hypothetical protein